MGHKLSPATSSICPVGPDGEQLNQTMVGFGRQSLGSFVAVAKRRNVDASSASRAIAALEARIGVRLFRRTTRSMKLTRPARTT